MTIIAKEAVDSAGDSQVWVGQDKFGATLFVSKDVGQTVGIGINKEIAESLIVVLTAYLTHEGGE